MACWTGSCPLWEGSCAGRERGGVHVCCTWPSTSRPRGPAGVYRSRAMANHFAAAGWDVTVVTVPKIFFTDYLDSYDPSLEATLHPASAGRAGRLRQAALGAGHPPDLLASARTSRPCRWRSTAIHKRRVPGALRVVGHERRAARAGAEPPPEVRRRDRDREPVRVVRGRVGDRQGAAHPLRRGLPGRLDLQPVLRGDRLPVPQPGLGAGSGAILRRRAGGRVRQRGDACAGTPSATRTTPSG